MTITQMIQNQRQQRIATLAQRRQGQPHVNPYGTPGMSLNGAGGYRKMVPVDESVVQQVKQIAFNHMKNGCGASDGEDISKVIRDYTMSLAPEKRLSSSWTLNEIFHSEATRLGEYVHQQDPSWDWGKPFDTSILDGYQQGGGSMRFDTVFISAESAAPVESASEEQVGDMTAFTSFAEEFSKITQDYSNTIRQNDMSLVINKNREVDPDGSIALQTYVRAYAQPAMEARKAITAYYADAHAENSSYPFLEGLEHIAQKYKRPDSAIFRSDLPKAQRDMYYCQERALLTGARVTLFDPYALASIGGIQTAQASHEYAMQAVQEKMAELWMN